MQNAIRIIGVMGIWVKSILDKLKLNIGGCDIRNKADSAYSFHRALNNQNLSTINVRKLIFSAVGVNHTKPQRTVLLAYTLYYLVYDVSSSTSDQEEKIPPHAHVRRTKEK